MDNVPYSVYEAATLTMKDHTQDAETAWVDICKFHLAFHLAFE